MPNHSNISIILCSQFDLAPLQEYVVPLPPLPTEPPSPNSDKAPVSPTGSTFSAETIKRTVSTPPRSLDFPLEISASELRTSCVYVQAFPCAQFWVRWRIIAPPDSARKRPLPPVPPRVLGLMPGDALTSDRVNEGVKDEAGPEDMPKPADAAQDGVKYYYFKLFVDGHEVVSWSAGAEDGWRGKVVFGLFAGKNGQTGGSAVEKRYLHFGKGVRGQVGEEERTIVVKVYRAKGRKRMVRDLEALKKTEAGKIDGQGIRLVNIGLAQEEHPKRFYKFALLDPLDEAYATFRFYYRTMEQLVGLGVVKNLVKDDSSDSEISLSDAASSYMSRTDSDSESFVSSSEKSPAGSYDTLPAEHRHENSLASVEDDADETQSQAMLDGYHTSDSDESDDTEIAAPSAASEASPAPPRSSSTSPGLVNRTQAMFKRLSFPPSTRLQPCQEGKGSASPQKLRRPPRIPTEEAEDMQRLRWLGRSPSPIKRSFKEGVDAPRPEVPELAEKRPGSGASLRRVLSRAIGRVKSGSPDKEGRQLGGSSAEG